MKRGIILVLCLAATTSADIYTLGDLDGGIYDGPGSIDDVYVESSWYQEIIDAGVDPSKPKPFDQWWRNYLVPMSFAFAPTTATEAYVQLVMQASDVAVTTDGARIEVYGNHYTFDELGWLPLSRDEYEVRTLDLSSVVGTDYLGSLADGILSLIVSDDVSVDFAVLTIDDSPLDIDPLASVYSGRGVDPTLEVAPTTYIPPNLVPVPASVLLGVLGLGTAGWRLRRGKGS